MNYSLLVLYCIIPLIFSHFFVRLGEGFVIENGIGNFESVKVSYFLMVLIIATIESSFRSSLFSKRTTWILAGLLISGTAIYYSYSSENLLGIGEKQHGMLFIAGLIWCGYLLKFFHKTGFRYLKKVVIASGIIVAIIGIIESIFSYNIIIGVFSSMEGSWGGGRSTATLGNPNYLAGYLLMLVPLSLSMGRIEKWGILMILSLGIISTKSVIGITLLALYFIYIGGKRIVGKWALFITAFIFGVGSIIALNFIGESEKLLSLTSRFILMKETLSIILDNPHLILTGHGPNGIIEFYNTERSEGIRSYFPDTMIIDSSHNIFIDILMKFGLFGVGILLYWCKKRWNNMEDWARYGMFLGFAFFSLNVIVLTHWMLMLFFLSSKKPPEGDRY